MAAVVMVATRWKGEDETTATVKRETESVL